MRGGFVKVIKRLVWIIVIAVVCLILIGLILPDEEDERLSAYENDRQSSVMETSGIQAGETIDPVLLESGAVREKQVHLKGDGTDTVTIMVYMNGSDLESDDGEATTDLVEMVKAGDSPNVNIVVQTMGTKKWKKTFGIASNRSQRYSVDRTGIHLLQDDLGQLDCTVSGTLTDFVKWSAASYPADRYILMFWDHGGGPVYGFGYDQWNKDETASLTVAEMQEGLRDAGVYFDFIGMDCCIMSTLETCCALYDYCDYMILSEDFESGLGWSYTGWLKSLYGNSSIPTPELGKKIVDDFIRANETDRNGSDSILAVIDQSMMKVLYDSWVNFAYANEESLLESNFSRIVSPKSFGRELPALRSGFSSLFDFGFGGEDYQISDYFITDIMAVAQNVSGKEADALSSALAQTLVYVGTTEGDADMTGIAVTLPYNDSSFYKEMASVFRGIGMDDQYVSWLSRFSGVKESGSDSYYDYDDYDWNGWEEYDDEYDWEDSDLLDEILNELFFGWDDFEYEDSYNNWYDEEDWYYDEEEDSYYYNGKEDDWYWDDGYEDHHGNGGGLLEWLLFW